MSGDVQPRKRKDKKRKREEESVPFSFYPKEQTEDVTIHVHKEEGTGGGICAKIVFFILFSALIVLIGLIITEHRGLTDLDVAESESRYSQIFEGWVDNEKQDDHHSLDDHHTLDDHDNEHFDDEEDETEDGHTLDDHDNEHIDDEPSEEHEHTLDDHDNEHYDDDDQSSPISEENEEDKEQSPEEPQRKYTQKLKTVRHRYRRQISEEDEDENVTESQQDLDDETEEEDVVADSETKEDEANEDEDNTTESQQYSEDDEEEMIADSDDKEETEEIQGDSENDNEDRTVSEEDDNENKVIESEENDKEPLDDTEEVPENPSSETPENDEEPQMEEEISEKASEENLDLQDDKDEEEKVVEDQIEEVEKPEIPDDTPENSGVADNLVKLSMVVKAIIGAAILAVGHFVLVKKWKSDSPDGETKGSCEKEEVHIDLSRRNTLIPPPTLQEIVHDVEYANEEYSDEDESGNIEGQVVTDFVKNNYEQLRSSYSRSISPETDTGDENEQARSDEELDIENIEDIEEQEEEEEEIEDEELEDDIQEAEIDEEEDEEEDYEEEEYEEEDDDELMKKLEAKYGKLQLETKGRTPSPDQESDSEKFSDDNIDYEYSSITNKDDWHIREDLDEAQKNLPDNAAKALKMFEKILEKYPSSPRGLYGLARALDAFAEIKRSNELLEEAVANYMKISDLTNVPDDLYKIAMERCIDRLRFRGRYGKAVTVHLKLIKRFPDEPKYRNELVVTYLTIGRVEQARLVLEETLQKWPNDGCALVHYGFIWKTTDNNLIKGVQYMQKGIETKDPCVIDGRFYFHLGDALFRLGYKDEALKLYEDGVQHKLFLSKYQRSLYNVNHLTARPWWALDQLLRYKLLFEDLMKNWQVIRNEGLSALNQKGYFEDESENLRNTGDWKQFELFARGRKHTKNCKKTPVTCKIIESHPDASGCRRGQTKFSVMHPGTHVWAHCGPTNCRLRVHLGLKVPTRTFIRVGDEIRSWEEGKLLIFDDSFEHEVWHNGTDTRLVLIVDVWHPELSMTERETLSSL